MFFQRKLPVSLSSCITLSCGEMMTVSSSISLHARSGFFCQTTAAGVLIKEEPPKTWSCFGRPGYSRIFRSRPDLGFQEAADWLPPRRRKKAHWAGGREESPAGGVGSRGFLPLAQVEKRPPGEHCYSNQRPGIRPKKEFRSRATFHVP